MKGRKKGRKKDERKKERKKDERKRTLAFRENTTSSIKKIMTDIHVTSWSYCLSARMIKSDNNLIL